LECALPGTLWFKQRQSVQPGHVYKSVASPNDVLAIIEGEKKTIPWEGTEVEVLAASEYEFIIDARRLRIDLLETWHQLMRRERNRENRDRKRRGDPPLSDEDYRKHWPAP
jgi:hypothetical protein